MNASRSPLPIRTWIEANFRVFLDSAPDAMLIVDGQGCMVLANALTERLFGYSNSELFGQKVEVLVATRFRVKHPIHRTGYFAQNPQVRPMGAGLDPRGIRKNGSEFPVEISLSPIQTPQGTMILSAIRDLSIRLRAEERFKGLMESAPDAMVILDEGGVITLVNARAEVLFGYSRSELVGQPSTKLMPERYRAEQSHRREDFLADPQARSMGTGYVLYGLRKDGSEFPIETSQSLLTADDTTFIRAFRDVTERKLAEAQIRALNDELEQAVRRAEKLAVTGRLIATVAHEINNPLESLASSLYLLGLEPNLGHDAKELVESAQRDVGHLSNISRETLTPYRESKLPVVTKVFQLLDDTMTMFRRKLEVAQIDVRRDYQTEGEVTIYPTELRQAFTNLITNAIDAIGQRGELTLSVERWQDREVVVRIADTGCGIPAENINTIFEPFFTTKGEKGTGIGLWVTKGIVAKAGGRIEVVTSTTGKTGTRFSIFLPVPLVAE